MLFKDNKIIYLRFKHLLNLKKHNQKNYKAINQFLNLYKNQMAFILYPLLRPGTYLML